MKRVFMLSLFFAVMSVVSATAQERFRIDKVLKEISPKQAEAYNPLFVSTYSYTINGQLVSKRYFVAAQSPQHNSSARVIESESSTQPWLLEINGRSVYVDFYNDSGLRTGDEGVIRYNGDQLYFIID